MLFYGKLVFVNHMSNMTKLYCSVSFDRQYCICCALVDCNQPAMTALFEYSCSLACKQNSIDEDVNLKAISKEIHHRCSLSLKSFRAGSSDFGVTFHLFQLCFVRLFCIDPDNN